MQILLALGPDAGDEIRPPVEALLARLRFSAAPQVDLVHVLWPHAFNEYDVAAYVSPEVVAAAHEAEHRCADDLVAAAENRLRGAPTAYPCAGTVVEGHVVPTLLQRAKETRADLIAANGTHHGEVGALLVGSVIRGLLADAPCSVLVAKPYAPRRAQPASDSQNAPVRAVLATDHSAYAERCIDRLLAFAPRGIGHVTLVTAYPAERLRTLGGRALPQLSVDLADAARRSLEEKSETLLGRLRTGLCQESASEVTFAARVIAGPVHEVIAAAMREAEADLLIVGARGHGFVERLTLGSVSYREAVGSPYPVLVLRA